MRIYISGAITGKEEAAKEEFENAAMHLRREYPEAEIIDPYRVNRAMEAFADLSHDEFMAMSFAMLDLCNAIYMIDGWETSIGANQEYGYAKGRKYLFVE